MVHSPVVAQEDIAFYRAMPKVHLHSHIAGMVSRGTVQKLSARHGTPLSDADVRALFTYYDFSKFVDILTHVTALMRTEQDFSDVAYDIAREAHEDGVVHQELFFQPTAHLLFGVSLATALSGLTDGFDRAEAEFGITTLLIAGLNRQLPGPVATHIVRQIIDAASPVLVGIGLEDFEVGGPPEFFAEAYALAGAHGLRRTAHAGEHGPAQNVITALTQLGCDRIDHGYKVVTEPTIAYRLADNGVHFTTCPTVSSRQGWADRSEHVLATMHKQGLWISINADDHAIINTTLSREFALAQKFIGTDRDTMVAIARRAVDACWLNDSGKSALRKRFDTL